jgi:hypothetical protein
MHNYNGLTLEVFHVNLLFPEAHFTSHADNSFNNCSYSTSIPLYYFYYSYLTGTPLFYSYITGQRIFTESRYVASAPTALKTQLYCLLALTAQKKSRCCYCCVTTNWGYVILPYCCATQYLSRNLATRGAMRSEGKGGEARRGSAPLLLHNRVPWGFWISSPPAWGDYATICSSIMVHISYCNYVGWT